MAIIAPEGQLPEWVLETVADRDERHAPACPICGAPIDPEGWGMDCGCYNDIHYGKD